MDMNPNDPRVQQMLAMMRGAQGGAPGGMAQPQPTPQMPQGAMPMQQPGGPVPAAPMQNGPQPMAPPPGGGMGAPGGAAGGAQLDPAMIDAVMGLQGQGSQRAGLDRQYKLADALRAGSSKQLEGRNVPSSTGGMYIAPSWANGLVSAGQQIMADRSSRGADEKGAGLDKERQTAQRGFFDSLTGGDKKKKKPDDAFTTDPMAGY